MARLTKEKADGLRELPRCTLEALYVSAKFNAEHGHNAINLDEFVAGLKDAATIPVSTLADFIIDRFEQSDWGV